MRLDFAQPILLPACILVLALSLWMPPTVTASSDINVAGYVTQENGQWVLWTETCKSKRPSQMFLLDSEQAGLWGDLAGGVAIVDGTLEEIRGTSYVHAAQVTKVTPRDFCAANPAGSIDVFLRYSQATLGPGASAFFEINLQSRSETPILVATTVTESSLPPRSTYEISTPSLQLQPNASETLTVQILTDPSTSGSASYAIMMEMEFNSTKTRWETYLLPTLQISSQPIPEFAQNPWVILFFAVATISVAHWFTRTRARAPTHQSSHSFHSGTLFGANHVRRLFPLKPTEQDFR
jgi:hypothetical protein